MKLTPVEKVKKELCKIITYHSDGGTSGYELSEDKIDKIKKILELIEKEYQEGFLAGYETKKELNNR